MYNLCSKFFARRVGKSDPLFLELAEAWVKALPSIICRIRSRKDIVSHPVFGNLGLGKLGAMVGGVVERQVVRKVGDLLNRDGVFDVEFVIQNLSRAGVMTHRARVEGIIGAVQGVIGQHWEGGEVDDGSSGSIDFVWADGEIIDFTAMTSRFW